MFCIWCELRCQFSPRYTTNHKCSEQLYKEISYRLIGFYLSWYGYRLSDVLQKAYNAIQWKKSSWQLHLYWYAPDWSWFCKGKKKEQGKERSKSYNGRYSLVVTYLTTNPPVRYLNRAKWTGGLVVSWSLTTKVLNPTISNVAAAEKRPQMAPICELLHALVAQNISDWMTAFIDVAIYSDLRS